MHGLLSVALLVAASGADSSTIADRKLMIGPFLQIVNTSDPTTSNVSTGWGGGAVGLWPVGPPWLSLRAELEVSSIHGASAPLVSVDTLFGFSDTLTTSEHATNTTVYIGVGPQFEVRAGPAVLFGFATAGLSRFSSDLSGPLYSSTYFTDLDPERSAGWGWNSGVGARLRLGATRRIWLSVEADVGGAAKVDYLGEPPLETPAGGISRTVIRHGPYTMRKLRLMLTMSP